MLRWFRTLTFLPWLALVTRSETLCKADTRAFALIGSTFISLMFLKGSADLVQALSKGDKLSRWPQ